MKATIALLDGGEILTEALRALETIAQRFDHQFQFRDAADADGCRDADAVLLDAPRPELREALALWVNLRPVRLYPSLAACSPLRPERLLGVDLLAIHALDRGAYADPEIQRVTALAFALARGRRLRVTSIDELGHAKRGSATECTREVAQRFPDIELEHLRADAAMVRLFSAPGSFDVIVTDHLFGDVLADAASGLSGARGLGGNAMLGDGRMGVYGPIASDARAGQANPIGAMHAAALLLRYSLGLEAEALALEAAIAATIRAGLRTADLATPPATIASAARMAAAIRARIETAQPEPMQCGAW